MKNEPITQRSRRTALSVDSVSEEHCGALKLLIVDDHAVVREGLEAMLGIAPDVSQIATAACARAALEQCERLLPDVILLDLRMPGEDGFEAMRDILARWPAVRILILSASATQAEVGLARRLGAAGYLSKSADRAALLAAVRAVARGEAFFPTKSKSQEEAGTLTGRELEVLQHLGRGITSSEMGRVLGISEHTVKGHLKLIYAKLGASDRAEAVARCYEMGLL